MPGLFQKILISAAVLGLVAVEGAPSVEPRTATEQGNGPKAIYFLTNEAQNAVVALPVGCDGTLSGGSVTGTGGKGSNAIDTNTSLPAAPDALGSQSALTVSGQYLFAVNAGSNTLTMFSISARDPTKLTALGRSASVPGDFPVTVAASAKNNLVCVGTTGVKSGVSCTSFSSHGLGKLDALRPFGLGQTNPPVGPFNTVSHTFFSSDESVLFTTVKGNPPLNNTGFVSAFPVKPTSACGGAISSLSTSETRSSPAGTAVLFGSAAIPGSTSLFVTDASFGGAVLSVDSSNKATLAEKGVISNQSATCWVTISDVTGTAFVTDIAVNRLVQMSTTDASIISSTDLSANGGPGLTDLASGGNFVYALSAGDGTTKTAVTVLDVSEGEVKQIQHFDVSSTGAGKNSQGMTVLM
ncbi:hypothetical protein V498_02542 [Pseudogymnoascus sp. VKM F-4517 (FW-2822)]|nr:hypothetical protein V498_02542 [Pseudogymnoascus sp. VKM F-4517 (FW-2822)]